MLWKCCPQYASKFRNLNSGHRTGKGQFSFQSQRKAMPKNAQTSKDWCCCWNSNILANWCEELTHLKRPWCWERLRTGGERDNRGWDGWMVSPTQWTWVWVNSGSWWWTGTPGVLWFMGSQRVRHDWATELNWISLLHSSHMQQSNAQNSPCQASTVHEWCTSRCSNCI